MLRSRPSGNRTPGYGIFKRSEGLCQRVVKKARMSILKFYSIYSWFALVQLMAPAVAAARCACGLLRACPGPWCLCDFFCCMSCWLVVISRGSAARRRCRAARLFKLGLRVAVATCHGRCETPRMVRGLFLCLVWLLPAIRHQRWRFRWRASAYLNDYRTCLGPCCQRVVVKRS